MVDLNLIENCSQLKKQREREERMEEPGQTEAFEMAVERMCA